MNLFLYSYSHENLRSLSCLETSEAHLKLQYNVQNNHSLPLIAFFVLWFKVKLLRSFEIMQKHCSEAVCCVQLARSLALLASFLDGRLARNGQYTDVTSPARLSLIATHVSNAHRVSLLQKL